MGLHSLMYPADDFEDGGDFRLSLFNQFVHIFLEFHNWSATAVFSAIIALAQLASEPTARNSKRLPVKAKGEVRLRSVLSINKFRNLRNVQLHAVFAAEADRGRLCAVFDVFQHLAQTACRGRKR